MEPIDFIDKMKLGGDKSQKRAALPNRSIKDIKREVGGDTRPLLEKKKIHVAEKKEGKTPKLKQVSLLEPEKPKKEGFVLPDSEIVNVRKIPDLDSLIEVSDLCELRKVGREFKFINRFEGEREVVFFVGNYFYREGR